MCFRGPNVVQVYNTQSVLFPESMPDGDHLVGLLWVRSQKSWWGCSQEDRWSLA